MDSICHIYFSSDSLQILCTLQKFDSAWYTKENAHKASQMGKALHQAKQSHGRRDFKNSFLDLKVESQKPWHLN